MNPDFIKFCAAAVGLILFLDFSLRAKNKHLNLVVLYFTSLAIFAQNFNFYFRELHQFIQICIILIALQGWGSVNSLNSKFMLFGIFILISFLFNPFDEEAQIQAFNYLVIVFVVNYLFFKIKSILELVIVFKFIGRLTIALSILGIFEYVTNPLERIEVSFANPNYLGLFLGVGFCFVRNYSLSFERYFGSFCILCAIIFSGSRAAFAIPVFYLLWMTYVEHGFKKAVLYSVASVALIVAILLSGLTRFSDVDSSQSSDAERQIIARVAVNMALDHPYNGVGWGRFIGEFQNYSNNVDAIILAAGTVDVSKEDRRVTHNDLLRILSELGFLAFFLSLMFVIKNLLILNKFKNSDISYMPPIWMGFIFFSMTHNNLNTAYSWFFLMLPFVAIKRKWIK
jgi:O-antigen ligase